MIAPRDSGLKTPISENPICHGSFVTIGYFPPGWKVAFCTCVVEEPRVAHLWWRSRGAKTHPLTLEPSSRCMPARQFSHGSTAEPRHTNIFPLFVDVKACILNRIKVWNTYVCVIPFTISRFQNQQISKTCRTRLTAHQITSWDALRFESPFKCSPHVTFYMSLWPILDIQIYFYFL